ncbi:MAG: T9SS type A sorting domain-containing protein [Candidatus Zixiibacteriota bacterium]
MRNLSKLSLLLLFIAALAFAQSDTIPPHVVNTNPLDGATGVDTYAPVIFNIADDPSGSGIDTSSIDMLYSFGDDTVVVEPTISPAGAYDGWSVTYEHTDPFTSGEEYTFGIHFADNAENEMFGFITFTTRDDTPLEDVCEPIVLEFTDTSECLAPDADLVFQLDDPMGPDCPDPSDINPETIHFWIDGVDHTDECSISPAGYHGFMVNWDAPYTFDPGTTVEIGIDCEDYAGNSMEQAFFYDICEDTPVDECPPIIAGWYPDSCVSPTEPIGIFVDDPHSDECPVTSGVDLHSISVTVDGEDVTRSLYIIGEGPYGRYIEWSHPGYVLPAGESIEVCVHAEDMAGHIVDSCWIFEVCDDTPTIDDCPPVAEWDIEPGSRCIESDEVIGAVIADIDTACETNSGVNPATIHVDSDIGGSWHEVTAECDIYAIPGTPGFYQVNWNHDDAIFEPGDVIGICLEAADFDGNVLYEYCTEYEVCEEAVDSCPPEIVEWMPDPETCLEGGDEVAIHMVDPFEGDCHPSDIDNETVSVTANGIDVTGDCMFTPTGEHHLWVDWHLPMDPGATSYEICIAASDFAGLWVEECQTYTVCEDTVTPPEDECPPEVVEFTDTTRCIRPEDRIFLQLVDPMNPDCPDPSNIDPSTINFWIDGVNRTADCTIEPAGSHSYMVTFDDIASLTPGSAIEVGIDCEDYAGNAMERPFHYEICEAPVDECPPLVVEMYPIGDDCVPAMTDVGFVLRDDDAAECFVSGINMESIEVSYGDAIVPEDELRMWTYGDNVTVEWFHDGFEPGTTYEVCISLEDNAENHISECNTFTICEDDTITPPDTTDDCPPRIDWAMEPLECYPPDLDIAAVVIDDSYECRYHSGVDPEALSFWVDGTEIGDVDIHELPGIPGAWGLRWEHDPLEHGTTYSICIEASDLAGNITEDCIEYTVCEDDTITPPDSTDDCPPVAVEIYPPSEDCVEPDVIVGFNIADRPTEDCFASGIDIESIELFNGETPVPDDDIEILHTGSDFAVVNWLHAPLDRGEEYEICISFADRAGNHSFECNSFIVCDDDTTTPPDSTDDCPPVAVEIYPPSEDCVASEVMVGFNIADRPTPDCFASGIDMESIELHHGDAEIPAEETEIIPMGDYGAAVNWLHEPLMPGEEYEICISFADMAGNDAFECNTFIVCDDDTTTPPDTTDECPPEVVEWYPDHCLDIMEPFGVLLDDPLSPGCPVASGINVDAISVYLDERDITSSRETIITPEGAHGARVQVMTEMEPGHEYMLCVEGTDFAGNDFEYCNEFFACDTVPEDTIDTAPPCIEMSWPEDGAEIPTDFIIREGGVCILLSDVCDPGTAVSGVDESTIEISIDGTVYGADSPHLSIEPREDVHGFMVCYFDTSWETGDHEVCIAAEDHAGNPMEDCIIFTLTEPVEDTSPPCVVSSLPEDGAEIDLEWMLREGGFCFTLSDLCDGAIEASGIDPASIEITLDGEEIPHTAHMWSPRPETAGGMVCTIIDGWEPGDYEACITFADYAGHSVTHCIDFTITGEVPEDVTPPCVVETWPEDGGFAHIYELTSEGFCFWVSDICEPDVYSSGIDEGSIEITIDGIEISVDEILISPAPEIGGITACVEGYEGFEEGESYEACISAMDYADLPVEYCFDFEVTRYDTSRVDTTGPCYEWSFEPHDTLFSEMMIGIDMCDVCGPGYASGVDSTRAATEITISGMGETYIIEDYTQEPNRCLGYNLDFNLPDLEPGEYTICIEARDYEGNVTEECIPFYIVDDTPPEDIWPPCGEWIFDDGDTLVAGNEIGIDVCDNCYDSATVFSGVDESTIVVTLREGIRTDTIPNSMYEVIPNYCHGVGIFSMITTDHAAGRYTLCVYLEDRAGNVFEDCQSFIIVDDIPIEDTIPPCVIATWPEAGAEVDLDWMLREGGFCFTLSDFCADIREGSGVDHESIEITLDGEIVPSSALNWFPRPTIAGGMVCTVIDEWEAGVYEACITFSDIAGNETDYCFDFTVVDDAPAEDIYPPCASWSFEEGDTVSSPFDVNIALCDLCDAPPHDASGVSRSSLELFFGPCGTEPTPVEDFRVLEIDCMGYSIHHTIMEEPAGCYQLCVHASDRDGNEYEECREFFFGASEYDIEVIQPESGVHISCTDYEMAFIFDGAIPDGFTFTVDFTAITMSNPGVRVSADTVFYAPPDGWTYGIHRALVGTEYITFAIDDRQPNIALLTPDDRTSVPEDLEIIEVFLFDHLSGVDEASILATIGGSPYTLSTPALDFDIETGVLTIDLSETTLELLPGESFDVCVSAGDIIDICESNNGNNCWTFTISDDTPSPTRKYIAGYVLDESTDEPIEGILVNMANYVTHETPFHPVAGDYTDSDGYFEIEVRYWGNYIVGAFDESMPPDYSPEFWEEQTCHLLADPVTITATSPETTHVGFTLSPYSEMTLFRVTGTIGIIGDGPIMGARVVAISSDEDDEEWHFDETDSLGLFELLIPEGTYYILAHSAGFMPGYYGGGTSWEDDAELIEVTGDIDGIDIDLPLAAPDSGAFGLHISVLEEDSTSMLLETAPVRGAMVSVIADATNYSYSGITDTEGVSSFYDIPEGEYSIRVDRFPYSMVYGPYDVSLPPTDVDITVYMRERSDEISSDIDIIIPDELEFSVYPNPFNSAATMEFELEEASNVQIDLYDQSGRIVYSLPEGHYNAGNHSIKISGNGLATGVYFCTIRLSGSGAYGTEKMILIK